MNCKITLVGPMIVIDSKLRAVKYIKKHCMTEDCISYDKEIYTRFCPECGEEVPHTPYTKHEYTTWWSFVNTLPSDVQILCENRFSIPEHISTGDKIIVVSNIKAHNVYVENVYVPIDQVKQSAHMREFRSLNADLIERINEFFGVGNVTVTFGFCDYSL